MTEYSTVVRCLKDKNIIPWVHTNEMCCVCLWS